MKRKEKAKGKTVNVLAAVRIARASGRDNLSGIFRFIEQNSGWQLHLVQYNEEFSSAVVRSAKDSGFDGIIATIPGSDATIAALAETPLPVVLVNVHGPALAKRKSPTAIIRNDNAAIGRLAAATFLKNGHYASFAYVPKLNEDWCHERGESFRARLAENGQTCSVFASSAKPDTPCEDREGLAAFLADLPKPTAVYASSDECAVKVLAAANDAGVKIPEQMALMGTDNDEFLVRHSTPPISSILPGHVKMGLRAASELAKLLKKSRRAPSIPKPIYIPPVSVIERASTKPVLPAATLVARTKAFIAEHGCERIDVADVSGHLGVSRRLAELRFRQMEGTSIRRAIEDRRMEEAKRLLAKTNLSVTAIAKRIGFSGQNRLSHVFKSRFEHSPENWRAELRKKA